MPKRQRRASDYYRNVFINCPFDDGYKKLFQATVFTVLYCGREPRSALEIYNSGQVRIEKIFRLIETCRFGIHDIYRTELNADSGHASAVVRRAVVTDGIFECAGLCGRGAGTTRASQPGTLRLVEQASNAG